MESWISCGVTASSYSLGRTLPQSLSKFCPAVLPGVSGLRQVLLTPFSESQPSRYAASNGAHSLSRIPVGPRCRWPC